MAIDTKPNFSCKKFEQCTTDIMNLSGCTQIYGQFDIENGATLTICENAGAGKVLTSNASGVATWQLTSPNLNTVDNVTSNQSLGVLPTGQTLGMVYITNTGSSQANIYLGTTALGNDITPFQPITIDANEDVSVTVNMRLSLTGDSTIYINSDDWTNVGLNVQWAHITYKNAPLPTGGTGGGLSSSSNGLTDDGTTVKLGGTLSENTCIGGSGSNYGLTFSGSSYYCIDNSDIAGSYISLLAQGTVNLEACNVCGVLGGGRMCLVDNTGATQIELSVDGDNRFCNLAAKTTETDVLYINSSTGRIVTGATTGGSTSPGGVDGTIQYNNGGTFGGTNLCFDDSLNRFGINTSATTTSMITLLTDKTYDQSNNYLEILLEDGGGSCTSEFKISTDNPFDLDTTVHTHCIDGYYNGSPDTLFINTTNSQGVAISDLFISGCSICNTGDILIEGNDTSRRICVYPRLNVCSIGGTPTSIEGDIMRFSGHTSCPDGLYYDNGSALVQLDNPTASAGGLDGNMQYNNGGILGGTCLNWDDSLNHIGWNTGATTNAMFTIAKDVSYDTTGTIMEFTGLEVDSTTVLSQFKIDIGSPSWGSQLYVGGIYGYKCGNSTTYPLCLSYNQLTAYDVYISKSIGICDNQIRHLNSDTLVLNDSSTSEVHICSILRLNPTTVGTVTPSTGMVYYDSGLNKLRVYTGSAWETISSS